MAVYSKNFIGKERKSRTIGVAIMFGCMIFSVALFFMHPQILIPRIPEYPAVFRAEKGIVSKHDAREDPATMDKQDMEFHSTTEVQAVDDLIKYSQNCLRDSPFAPNSAVMPAIWDEHYRPPVDAEQHYQDIMNGIKALPRIPPVTYISYRGPWLEDHWIKNFCCDKPLSDFGGLIPLFIPWNNIAGIKSIPFRNSVVARLDEFLATTLRKDVIYVTVSGNANGINAHSKLNISALANILVLSSGAFGHIPLPHLIQELEWGPFNKDARYMFSFAGSIYWYPARAKMVDVLQKTHNELKFDYLIYKGDDFIDKMKDGLLNLAPRGFGRTSFRLYEIIQMGLIPVHIWDDDEWIPYRDSPADLRNFGFSVQMDDFEEFVREIAPQIQADHDFLPRRAELMKHFRNSHYTYEGVVEQIRLFFARDPKNVLKCQRHPGALSAWPKGFRKADFNASAYFHS